MTTLEIPSQTTITAAPSHTSPGRIIAIVVGALIALATIGRGVIQEADLIVQTTTKHTVSYAAVAQLRISAPGAVTVSASSDGRIDVTTSLRNGLVPARSRVVQTSGQLSLTGQCSTLWSPNCAVSYDIAVPPSTRLDVSAESVVVDGVKGGATVRSDAGDITLRNVGGRIFATSSAGNITATGLVSIAMTARSSAGSVSLRFDSAPQHVVATSDAGDVTIAVPRGSGVYTVDAATSAGSRNVDVATSSDASGRIYARTSAGDITIRYSD